VEYLTALAVEQRVPRTTRFRPTAFVVVEGVSFAFAVPADAWVVSSIVEKGWRDKVADGARWPGSYAGWRF
jgi:hypothetical protein